MNDINKKDRYLSIVVIKMESEPENNIIDKDIISLIIIDNRVHFTLRGKKEESIKNIIQREKPQYINYTFYYNKNKEDLNKKFEDIIDASNTEDKFIVLNLDNVTVNFTYESTQTSTFTFNINTLLEIVIQKYIENTKKDINSLLFLCSGEKFEKRRFQKNFISNNE